MRCLTWLLFYSLLCKVVGAQQMTTMIPSHLVLLSAALAVLPKSIPFHYLTLSSHYYICLHFLLFPFTGSCRMTLRSRKQKALRCDKTALTIVWGLSCCQMAADICLRICSFLARGACTRCTGLIFSLTLL